MISNLSNSTKNIIKSQKIPNYTIPFSYNYSLKVYSEPKPSNSHISNLQKGLILISKNNELVGEGTGFGVPVLTYSKQTYFSQTSNLYFLKKNKHKIIYKQFLMDTISKIKMKNIELKNQSIASISEYIKKKFEEFYKNHKHFRFLSGTQIINKLGLRTEFVKNFPIGKIDVIYTISKNNIKIEADFRNVNKKNLQKINLLNEQSSIFFTKYNDSDNLCLKNCEIGAWDPVRAQWACITDSKNKVGFRLWTTKDCVLFRGREYLKNYLDWIGLDYELSSKFDFFKYKIEILGVNC